jgi:hypothetical protein
MADTQNVAPGAAAGEDIVAYVLRMFANDERPHTTFVTEADRRYRAYRGVLEDSAEAAVFPVREHPAYAFQVIETMAASLLDPRPRWRLRVAPRMASPAEIEKYRAGTRANEILLNDQLSNDHFAEKQRTYSLQGLITGITAGRSSWRFEEVVARSREPYQHNIPHPVTGLPWVSIPMMRDVEQLEVVHDDPTFEPKDIRDLIWQDGAISLQRSDRITERDWYSFDELKRLEKAGYFENVDQLKESRNIAQQVGVNDREQGLTDEDRAKDRIEVLTMWFRDAKAPGGLRVVSIGNRKVLLRDRPSPFWLERLEHPFPFVVASSQPDLFKIPGISEVEVIKELQDMLWSLGSQRLSNLQLINNAVWLLNKNSDNADDFDVYPGAKNLVDDPQEIQQWSPNPIVATVSLEAEALLKADLQNIPGASPALLGQQQDNTQTATEVSLVTSLAQRRLGVKKMQFGWSYMRMGEQWIALNQQYVREDRDIATTGPDGAIAWNEIKQDVIQGRYRISPEAIDESLVRQERRAEQQAKLQVAVSGGRRVRRVTDAAEPEAVHDRLPRVVRHRRPGRLLHRRAADADPARPRRRSHRRRSAGRSRWRHGAAGDRHELAVERGESEPGSVLGARRLDDGRSGEHRWMSIAPKRSRH